VSVYSTLSFTTASVAAGNTVDVDVDISNNYIDIYKIQIVPSVVGGTSVAKIFTNQARDAANLLYKTLDWDDAIFTDPIEDVGGIYNYRNEGFVARYEDADLALKLYLSITNNDSVSKTYDVIIVTSPSPYAPSVLGVPMEIMAAGFANGLKCLTAVEAHTNFIGINEAELRLKFYALGSSYPEYVDMSTAAEGGSFVDNGTTQRIFTGLPGDKTGATKSFTSGSQGRWYFAWKLQNASGWSKWSDGNEYPTTVTQWFETTEGEDTGPPAGWQVTLEKAKATNYYVVRVSRPRTNGNLIMWWSAQIKDASVGAWREVDANSGAAVTEYDGSGVNHTFDTTTNTLTAPAGWGTASPGDLVVYDVRGDTTWDLKYCLWNTIESISGNDIHLYGGGGRLGILDTATKVGDTFTEIRLKIVKPPWDWNTEGYLGDQANNGIFEGAAKIPAGWPLFDRTTKQFVSDPIYVPPSVSSPQARVWFHNGYSRSDDGLTVSTAIDGGKDIYNSGFIWYSFVDRDWWIPVVSQADNVNFEIEPAGTLLMGPNLAAPDHYPEFGVAGTVGRFRIYQDNTGVIQVRSKWTVNYVSTSSGGVYASLCWMGLGLENEVALGYGAGNDIYDHGMAFRRYYSGGLKLDLGHLRAWGAPSHQGDSWFSNIFYRIDPAPAMPITLEIRLTLDEDNVNISGGQVVMKTYEYQIDGGGWNTVTPLVAGPNMYGEWVGAGSIMGFMPRLLYWQQATASGDYVRLTEFEVIKGIVARE
jgi:hypothetical protein